jgi:hypothetical protein
MTREALKMCLEYIETDAHERKYVRHAIKEALAQPEQEPVAWWNQSKDSVSTDPVHRHNSDCQPLYITPPPCPTCEALARTVMMDQTGRDA